MTTHYEPIPEAQFVASFEPTESQKIAINHVVLQRVANITGYAFNWSEEAMLISNSPGFGIGDLATAFRNALKGKRGYDVSKIESYEDENPDCKFNTRFVVKVTGDGWWTRLVIVAQVGFGESDDRLLDELEAVAIYSGMDADDEVSLGRMVRWWTSVNSSKAEG